MAAEAQLVVHRICNPGLMDRAGSSPVGGSIALWCNGSASGFGPERVGSIPARVAML